MQLSAMQEVLPSEADVEFYDDHGWWTSPKVFSDEQIDEALDAAHRHYAEQPIPGDDFHRIDDHIVRTNDSIGAVGLAPTLGAIAARLARTSEVRLFYSSMIHKPAGVEGDGVTVGWHVERAYWQQSTSLNMLSAWIPLHDCDEQMGTITMIDRSHRWPGTPAVEAMRAGRRWADNLVELERELARLGHPIEKVPMHLGKGQVSFHHCLTFHGSDINRSDRPRIAVTVHFQDQDNRYQEVLDANGERIPCVNDHLVRRLPDGRPDYSDPEICPVIWREGSEPTQDS